MGTDKKLKRSLGRYAYWNFLFGKQKTDDLKRTKFKELNSSCQVACSPGDPCGPPESCSMD